LNALNRYLSQLENFGDLTVIAFLALGGRGGGHHVVPRSRRCWVIVLVLSLARVSAVAATVTKPSGDLISARLAALEWRPLDITPSQIIVVTPLRIGAGASPYQCLARSGSESAPGVSDGHDSRSKSELCDVSLRAHCHRVVFQLGGCPWRRSTNTERSLTRLVDRTSRRSITESNNSSPLTGLDEIALCRERTRVSYRPPSRR